MAERSVHEAAVEAVAQAAYARRHSWTPWGELTEGRRNYWRGEAVSDIAALVASAEVREARICCLRRGDTNLPCDWSAVHPECFLAALGGGES